MSASGERKLVEMHRDMIGRLKHFTCAHCFEYLSEKYLGNIYSINGNNPNLAAKSENISTYVLCNSCKTIPKNEKFWMRIQQQLAKNGFFGKVAQ